MKSQKSNTTITLEFISAASLEIRKSEKRANSRNSNQNEKPTSKVYLLGCNRKQEISKPDS